jgi:hypothetical protein
MVISSAASPSSSGWSVAGIGGRQVPAWQRAGMTAVGMVELHELRKKKSAPKSRTQLEEEIAALQQQLQALVPLNQSGSRKHARDET